jgi:Spy/CpxP family protein refolding chaperone
MKRWNAFLVELVGVKGLALSGLMAMVLWSTPNPRHSVTVFREPVLGSAMIGDAPEALPPPIPRGIGHAPEQASRVGAMMATHAAMFRALFRQLREDYEALADQLCAPEGPQAMAAIRQVPWFVQRQEQLIQMELQVTLEVRSALTPEQIAEVAQLNDWGLTLHAEMRGSVQWNPRV